MAGRKTIKGRQFKKAFTEVFKATRLLESTSNFSVADSTKFSSKPHTLSSSKVIIHRDQEFWTHVFRDNFQEYKKKIDIPYCTISKWLPRVPGLYWAKQSEALREFGKSQIESVNGKWIHLTPQGKSADVMGGIGTNMFAPDRNGDRLVCLTISRNASHGIPVLIHADVWDKLKLQDGYSVKISGAHWQLMDQQWMTRFISDAVSRAYLVINKPAQISVLQPKKPLYCFHPYSIMEYTSDDAVFYDYVFYTAEVIDGNDYYRKDAENFFEEYRKLKGRNGNYLLASDIEKPLFDASYASPEDIRRNESSGKTHLQILKEKIKQKYFHGKLLEEVIIDINKFYNDENDIMRIASYTGIPKNVIGGRTVADMVAELVYKCVEADKVEDLIDKIAQEYPLIIK